MFRRVAKLSWSAVLPIYAWLRNKHHWDEPNDIFIAKRSEQAETLVFILGDSQAEFLSRAEIPGAESICIHLGPVTALGVGFLSSPKDLLCEHVSLIKNYACVKKPRNIVVLVSLGTIDVKTFAYIALQSGLLKSDDDLSAAAQKAARRILNYLDSELQGKAEALKVGFYEVMYPNNMPFAEPDRKTAITYLRERFEVNPVLGDLPKRQAWTALFNCAISAACSEADAVFAEVCQHIDTVTNTKTLDRAVSFDGIHLSNTEVLRRIALGLGAELSPAFSEDS